MAYQTCEDCGCRIYSGICSNCHEELYLLENQSDSIDFSASQDFMDAANEQRRKIKRHHLKQSNPFTNHCNGEKRREMSGIELIQAERQRQMDVEGWTPEHDDKQTTFELSRAAASYLFTIVNIYSVANWWPWDWAWWKPSDNPVRNLVKAGALIAAEIDRIQRAE